jgi:hypothetical protein
MAADWTTIRANLATWAKNVTGLESHQVVWRDTADDNAWRGRAGVILDITAIQTIGTDEIIYGNAANPQAGAELDVTVCGQRTMTLGVRVEVQDQRAGYDAITYTELLRTSLRLPSTYALFSAAGVGFASVLAETDLESIYQGRRHSAAQLDILLNSYGVMTDSPDTYIETVEYETEMLGPDGNPVPHQVSGSLDLVP